MQTTVLAIMLLLHLKKTAKRTIRRRRKRLPIQDDLFGSWLRWLRPMVLIGLVEERYHRSQRWRRG